MVCTMSHSSEEGESSSCKQIYFCQTFIDRVLLAINNKIYRNPEDKVVPVAELYKNLLEKRKELFVVFVLLPKESS